MLFGDGGEMRVTSSAGDPRELCREVSLSAVILLLMSRMMSGCGISAGYGKRSFGFYLNTGVSNHQ